MGNGMNKVLSGLYVGNFKDSKDEEQLVKNSITHILSIHDNAKPLIKGKKYLCIRASDNPQQQLTGEFPRCIDFIHSARSNGGSVLVHCLAGMSRSVTLVASYLMTVTELDWRDSLKVIRGARTCANPNFGFQKQLQEWAASGAVQTLKSKLLKKYGQFKESDISECDKLMVDYQQWVLTGNNNNNEVDKEYPLAVDAYKEKPVKPDIDVKIKRSKSYVKRDSDDDDETDSCKLECWIASVNVTKRVPVRRHSGYHRRLSAPVPVEQDKMITVSLSELEDWDDTF